MVCRAPAILIDALTRDSRAACVPDAAIQPPSARYHRRALRSTAAMERENGVGHRFTADSIAQPHASSSACVPHLDMDEFDAS